MKLTEAQILELIPPEEVHRAFLARPDIARLPTDEQERRWNVHREKVREFCGVLAGMDCLVVKLGDEP